MCDRLIHVIGKALVTFDLTLAPAWGVSLQVSVSFQFVSVGLGRVKILIIR